MTYPYSFSNKIELPHAVGWAQSLMVQYHLSEPGPHSSNTGIPIGGIPSPVQKGV